MLILQRVLKSHLVLDSWTSRVVYGNLRRTRIYINGRLHSWFHSIRIPPHHKKARTTHPDIPILTSRVRVKRIL